ncbi:MAG: DUF4919 domain-containing protein [Prevotella sp.]|nr:DUF4919 domain-containing protein [Prevotella sp.]
MRQLFIFITILFLSIECIAQEKEFLTIDWEQIKKEAMDNPQQVKDLVARFSAKDTDTTLTLQEMRLAFYGQSFLTNDKEDEYMFDLYDQLRKKQLKECLITVKKILDINPLNLDALTTLSNIFSAAANATNDSGRTAAALAKSAQERAQRIFQLIAATGDGSKDHPFYVTKVSDEYCFMRHYLDLWEYRGQYMKDKQDVIMLKKKSENYKESTICFEITRVFELDMMKVMRKGKKSK